MWTGERVRKLRAEFNLTRNELAKLLNVSPSTIEKWEEKSSRKKEIRVKYIDSLDKIIKDLKTKTKGSLLGAALSAPVVTGPLLLGGAAGLSYFLNKKNIKKTVDLLNQLSELTEDEREKFLKILEKL